MARADLVEILVKSPRSGPAVSKPRFFGIPAPREPRGCSFTGVSENASTSDLRAQALTYALQTFGPATHRGLAGPALQRVAERCRDGVPIAEAVSAFAFEDWNAGRERRGEFLQSFREQLTKEGHRALGAQGRRRHDGEDLVSSVMGDLLESDKPLRFTTRSAFLQLLRQRMRWKAIAYEKSARKLHIEEPESETSVPLGFLPSNGRGPRTHVQDADSILHLSLQVFRLPPQEREVVRRRLKGERLTDIAQALGIRSDSVSHIFARARKKLRDIDARR